MFDEHQINPDKIKCSEDLIKVPITTRETLQKLDPREIVSKDLDLSSLVEVRTSGSSGQPLMIRRTWKEQMLLHAFLMRANRFLGLRYSDRLAAIGLRKSHHQEKKIFGEIMRKLGIYRITKINARLDPDEILAEIRMIKPDVITGYPSILVQIAGLMNKAERKIIRPRFLMVGAELLMPIQRNIIAKNFNAPIYDFYSSVEFHNIAWECKNTHEMHACDDSLIVEVINDGQPVKCGEEGEVVGTALHSYAMPLIRYRLGDIVTRGSEHCACGAPYSTIHKIQGRIADYIELPGDRKIHVAILHQTLHNGLPAWISQYQFVQERLDLIIVKIVPNDGPSPESIEKIVKSLSEALGPGVKVEVHLEKTIHLQRGSKHAILRSNI
jgi:phenylacetate-CoA ligase